MGPMVYTVVGLSAVLFVTWLAGSILNRRRAGQLVQAVRAALPALGGEASIRWFGAGAFQIDLAQPAPGLTRVQIVGLLEARDLALVWLYWRLRGRRDRLIVQADFRRPLDPSREPPALPGVTSIQMQAASPNLHLVLQVPQAGEANIGPAFQFVRDLAGGRATAV